MVADIDGNALDAEVALQMMEEMMEEIVQIVKELMMLTMKMSIVYVIGFHQGGSSNEFLVIARFPTMIDSICSCYFNRI